MNVRIAPATKALDEIQEIAESAKREALAALRYLTSSIEDSGERAWGNDLYTNLASRHMKAEVYGRHAAFIASSRAATGDDARTDEQIAYLVNNNVISELLRWNADRSSENVDSMVQRSALAFIQEIANKYTRSFTELAV